jgi:hypothetical protein
MAALSLFVLALAGCSDQPAVDKDAPNLRGEPAGPPPTVAIGGGTGGGGEQKKGPDENAKLQ